jgi:hypothetical protein
MRRVEQYITFYATDFQKPMIRVRRRSCIIFILSWFAREMRLIKMCLNETLCKFPVGKHLSQTFSLQTDLKQGDALRQLLFNFTFVYGSTAFVS